MTEAMTAEMRSGKSSPKKKWWDVSVSVAEIRKEYGEALSSAYQSVWDGLEQVEKVDEWWGWLIGRREEERMTLSQEVEKLLSQCNADGSPNYDAIVAMQAEVLAYDRAPIWKQAWQTAQGRGVERKRATLLGCQVKIHQRNADKSYKSFRYHTSRMKGDHLSFRRTWSPPKDDPFQSRDWSFKDQLGKLSWVYSAAKSAFTGFYDFICGGLPGHKPRKGINAGHIAEALHAQEEEIKYNKRVFGPGSFGGPTEDEVRAMRRKLAVPDPKGDQFCGGLAHAMDEGFQAVLDATTRHQDAMVALIEGVINLVREQAMELEQLKRGLISCLDIIVERCSSLPRSQFELTESRGALLDGLKEQIRSARTGAELVSIAEGERYQSVINDWVPSEAREIVQQALATHGGSARGFADTDVMRRAMGLAPEGAAAAPEDSVPSAVM